MTTETQNNLSLQTISSFEKYAVLSRRIDSGEVRIPHFQRGIVWDVKKTAALFDSILKGVPFGKITLWESSIPLEEDRLIAPTRATESFSFFKYVLDGQQRITSIYKTFHAFEEGYRDYRRIYVDLTVSPKNFTLEPLCFFKHSNDNSKHFPIYILFSENLRNLVRGMGFEDEEEDNLFDYKEKLDNFDIHFDTIKTENQEVAASVFVAINNGSSRLTETDLMAAILFDQESDWYFHSKSKQLMEEAAARNFEMKPKRQLQLLSLVCFGNYHPKSISQLSPRQVIPLWSRFRLAMNQTIDYITTDLKINKMSDLTTGSLFNTIFFFFYRNRRNPNLLQRKNMHKLILSSGLLQNYATSTVDAVRNDAQVISRIIAGESVFFDKPLRYITDEEKKDILIMGDFKKVSSLPYYSKCFLLPLGMVEPKSIISGLPVFNNGTERINSVERHHIFPKSTHGVESDNIFNIMLLDSASNNAIGNNHPSVYLTLERFNEDAQFREILSSHFIGLDEIVDIQNNDLESFKRHRMTKIMDYISNLFD